MPQWVRERTDENAARNVQRLRKLEQIHSTVSQRLASADIEFEVLKGRLPATTRAWFAALATSPVCSVFDSNEDELWLHRTLLDSRRDSGSTTRRRLLPASYLLSQIVHRLLALPRTAASGARWWWRIRDAQPPQGAQRSKEE